MISKEIKKCKKELQRLRASQSTTNNEYYDAIEEAGCENCGRYNREVVGSMKERHKNCDGCDYANQLRTICEHLDDLNEKISDYIENVYANVVFDYYKAKKPILLRKKTGERISWDEAFGEVFENVPKNLRHSLAGLPEGEGRYSIV